MKNSIKMKKIASTTFVVMLMILATNGYAKNLIGVYLTATDYSNKKQSFKTDSKIHLNNSLYTLPYITVIEKGKKIRLNKSDLYGYTSNDKDVFRFYKNDKYKISETGNVIIYTQLELISKSKGQEIQVMKHYFFSVTPTGEIFTLTLENLKNAYNGNDKLIDQFDQFFSGRDVTAYDSKHSMYKVNYVISKTIKQ